MAVLAQHGHGKSGKIERGLQNNYIDGVILSPHDESKVSLEAFSRSLSFFNPTADILFDPQFYVTTIWPVKKGRLPEYPYYDKKENLTRTSFSYKNIKEYVKACIDYQITLPVTKIIAPTIHFESFNDPWSQIMVNMAEESIDYYNKIGSQIPLYLSLVIGENAFTDFNAVDEFLDIISLFDVKGFYLLVKCIKQPHEGQIGAVSLEKLLYLIYSLSELNEFDVISGYSDIISLLYQAAGAKTTACGWYSNLRQFSFHRFEPHSGGGPAKTRYTSNPLLNSILLIPELEEIHRNGHIMDVLTNTAHDQIHIPKIDPGWANDEMVLHYWAAIKKITDDISNLQKVTDKLDLVETRIQDARALYRTLSAKRIVFGDSRSGSSHLDVWFNALRAFRNKVRV